MKDFIRHVFTLGVKEIIGIFRDPLLLILILYSFSISVYLGSYSASDPIHDTAIAIADEDDSPLSKRISDAFLPPMFRKPQKITTPEIDPAMDRGDYTFIIVFPARFQEKVFAGRQAEVQLHVDATRMSEAFIGNGYIQQIIQREAQAFLKESHPGQKFYLPDLVIRNRFNPNLIKTWEGAISELVNNIAMIALILTGAALIRERERGTLEHLMVTPVSPLQIMLSKIWSMSLVVLTATGFSLLFVIQFWLGIPVAGSFWLFMAGVFLTLFAMTSMGILISCFARDMPQLGILLILVLMPMQILSGGSTPLDNMPQTIQYVMKFAPTTYFVKLSEGILFRGAEFRLIWNIFLETFLLGCAYFLVALIRFRRSVSS